MQNLSTIYISTSSQMQISGFWISVDFSKVAAQIGSQKLHNVILCCFCKAFLLSIKKPLDFQTKNKSGGKTLAVHFPLWLIWILRSLDIWPQTVFLICCAWYFVALIFCAQVGLLPIFRLRSLLFFAVAAPINYLWLYWSTNIFRCWSYLICVCWSNNICLDQSNVICFDKIICLYW